MMTCRPAKRSVCCFPPSALTWAPTVGTGIPGRRHFLPKPFREQDTIDAVMAAIERDRERRATDSAATDVRDRYAGLSPREQQVMALVTAGKMNKQIAVRGLDVC